MSSKVATVLGAGEFNSTAVTIALLASVGLILLNGFYVAYEFAVLAAKRSSFEDGPRKRRSSAAARASLADVSMQLAGAQLGITIASLALGRISEPALEVVIERVLGQSVSPELAKAIGITTALGVFTILHLVFGEMVPKNIALAAPDATLRWLVIPYRLYLFVFRPVVRLLNGIANVCSRAVGIEPRDELKSVHTASELASIVADATEGGTIDADDAEMLRGALDFAQRPVSEIATPIGDHPSISLGATVGQLERAVANTGEGRILMLDPSRSSAPVGYVHVRDLLHIETDRREAPMPSRYVRNMAVVAADRPLVEVLLQLRSQSQYLAVVMDRAMDRAAVTDGAAAADRGSASDEVGGQGAGDAKVPVAVVSQEQVVRAIILAPGGQQSKAPGGQQSTGESVGTMGLAT